MSRIRIVSGTAGGLFIRSPQKFSSRPTQERVREAFFSSIASMLPGASFLDIYAGSGAVGIEALSRGAAATTFIEKNRNYCKTIQNNLKHCRLQGTVMCQDAESFLIGRPTRKFDIIFADPPYDQKTPDLDTLPFASYLHHHLAPGGLLVWEHDLHSRWNSPESLEIRKVKKMGETRLSYLELTRSE